MLRTTFVRFARDEGGAVAADWVVLTSAIVGLGLAIVTTVSAGVMSGSDALTEDLGSAIEQGSDTSAEPLGETAMTGDEFLAGFTPLSSRHGSNWGGGGQPQSWAQAAYGRMSAMSDSSLVSNYNKNYSKAAAGTSRTRADRAAVAQQVMSERGIGIPPGNKTSSEIRAMYQ